MEQTNFYVTCIPRYPMEEIFPSRDILSSNADINPNCLKGYAYIRDCLDHRNKIYDIYIFSKYLDRIDFYIQHNVKLFIESYSYLRVHI